MQGHSLGRPVLRAFVYSHTIHNLHPHVSCVTLSQRFSEEVVEGERNAVMVVLCLTFCCGFVFLEGFVRLGKHN